MDEVCRIWNQPCPLQVTSPENGGQHPHRPAGEGISLMVMRSVQEVDGHGPKIFLGAGMQEWIKAVADTSGINDKNGTKAFAKAGCSSVELPLHIIDDHG